MKDPIEGKLKDLIRQTGWSLAKEPRRVRALLRDLCPNERRDANLLIAVAEEGIAEHLVRDRGNTPAAVLVPRLAKTLHDERGIDQELALWAVATWAEALKRDASANNNKTTIGESDGQSASARSPTYACTNEPTTTARKENRSSQHKNTQRETTLNQIGATGRYIDNCDGTVTDLVTGLQWMRCALGQQWTGETCAGQPSSYNWQQALDAAKKINRGGGYAGTRDWRLPTIEELNTLIYCSSRNPGPFPFSGKKEHGPCKGEFQRPTIDFEAFPSTPPMPFWTASFDSTRKNKAWRVPFRYGNANRWYINNSYFVRLVRHAV
ncbi:DUF1566 domain-containing protein [Thioalkalivibrio sp. ALE11]|uniref:Lcl C-terminal domain-containing protein n=1 Tax=Thioalkalivibrio sp. ALE11 TaxID=1265494 RepID=UPI0009DAC24F|nr:DUF1566 domain-containing protein [Thioalkalivibrio sp. ALE11]